MNTRNCTLVFREVNMAIGTSAIHTDEVDTPTELRLRTDDLLNDDYLVDLVLGHDSGSSVSRC